MRIKDAYKRKFSLGQAPEGGSRVFAAGRSQAPLSGGQANDQVRDMQLLLNGLGYKLPVTGSFDIPTEVAVGRVQAKLNGTPGMLPGLYNPPLDELVWANYNAQVIQRVGRAIAFADDSDVAAIAAAVKATNRPAVSITSTGSPVIPQQYATSAAQFALPGIDMKLVIGASAIGAALLGGLLLFTRRPSAVRAPAQVSGYKKRRTKRRSKR